LIQFEIWNQLILVENSTHTKLLIFAPEITSRIEYTFGFIFKTILGVDPIFSSNQQEFLLSGLPKINYSPINLSSGLFLKSHPILFERSITIPVIEVVEYRQMQLFFPASDDSFLPFDPFAMTFYLVTRYEEYLNENTDEHDRFSDSENILIRLGLHQKPVVDQMAYWIAEKISEQFPDFKIKKRTFQLITTIDIDNAWAFKNKSLIISLGGIAKAVFHRHWDELKQRTVVFLGLRNDPYDTYKYILETYHSKLDHLMFFFLIGDRNQFDKNISHKNKPFRKLIGSLASVCKVGIHPSYASNDKSWLYETEKERLEKIIHQPVTRSRQHYLKLKFPKNYQNLLKSGITDDYTMGFPSLAGFRSGTCTPFPFFDLSRNTSTELQIHPFQTMDVTLKNYLHLDPQTAWQMIEELMLEVKKVNGTFISLWHNESLKNSGQWLGWREVFEQILEKGLILENE
jgi:hypothetical protein